MQWSHETTFAIIIFKISRLRLLAPLGDFCPPNHLVPSPVDDFSTRHGTSCSTSYKTIPPVRLETSRGVLSSVDMVVQRRDGRSH